MKIVFSTSFILLIILLNSSNGQSPCPTQCFQNSPICGSDGKVYRSKCDMEMKNCGKNVTVVDWINCEKDSFKCPKLCLEIYDPVCGSDGKLYSNKCLMQKKNCGQAISIVNRSNCVNQTRQSRFLDNCPKTCLLIDKPVCGSDKTLYRNECLMRQRNCGKQITAIDIRECVSQANPCPNRCLTIPDPVCGSDGKWYLNACWMNYENCGKSIKKVSKDKCKDRM